MEKGLVVIQLKEQKNHISFAKNLWKLYNHFYISTIHLYSDNGIVKIVIITSSNFGVSAVQREILGTFKAEIESIETMLLMDEIFPSQG